MLLPCMYLPFLLRLSSFAFVRLTNVLFYLRRYANGEWILLGAFAALLLSVCFSFCGSFGRFRRDRRDTY